MFGWHICLLRAKLGERIPASGCSEENTTFNYFVWYYVRGAMLHEVELFIEKVTCIESAQLVNGC